MRISRITSLRGLKRCIENVIILERIDDTNQIGEKRPTLNCPTETIYIGQTKEKTLSKTKKEMQEFILGYINGAIFIPHLASVEIPTENLQFDKDGIVRYSEKGASYWHQSLGPKDMHTGKYGRLMKLMVEGEKAIESLMDEAIKDRFKNYNQRRTRMER